MSAARLGLQQSKGLAARIANQSERCCRLGESYGWRFTHEGICSLNDDEGGVGLVGPAAVLIEFPATRHNFASRDGPRRVAVRQQACPGTAGAAKSLHEAQRAKNGNHPAFLNLDQRRQGSPAKLGTNNNYKPSIIRCRAGCRQCGADLEVDASPVRNARALSINFLVDCGVSKYDKNKFVPQVSAHRNRAYTPPRAAFASRRRLPHEQSSRSCAHDRRLSRPLLCDS